MTTKTGKSNKLNVMIHVPDNRCWEYQYDNHDTSLKTLFDAVMRLFDTYRIRNFDLNMFYRVLNKWVKISRNVIDTTLIRIYCQEPLQAEFRITLVDEKDVSQRDE